MSEDNIEIVRRLVEANRSGAPEETVERAVALAHEDLEFTSRLTSVEGSTYRGHDGLRRYFADLADTMQDWGNELNELRAVGNDAVMADVTFRATGRSGMDVELRSAAVIVLSAGKALQVHAYPTPEEALEAAGLSE